MRSSYTMTASLSTKESVSLCRNWLLDLLKAIIAASSLRIRFFRFLLKFTCKKYNHTFCIRKFHTNKLNRINLWIIFAADNSFRMFYNQIKVYYLYINENNIFITFAYKSLMSSSVERGLGLDLTQAGKLLVFNVGSPEVCSSLAPTSSNTSKTNKN